MSAGRQVSIAPPARLARPVSFTLLSLYLGWKALEAVGSALELGFEPLTRYPPDRLPLVTAVFAAVAAEALARCRPWCVRATIAYFAVAILAPVVASAFAGRLQPGEAVFSVIGRALFAAIPVLYVNYRASQLFAPHSGRVPVAVPRP